MFRVGGDGEKRFRSGAEKDAVNNLFVVKGDFGHFSGSVKTTWKYSTGNSSAVLLSSHFVRSALWHFGQWRLLQEL